MLELQQIMAASDPHANKCKKREVNFGATYPDDLAAYNAANTEYNELEPEVEDLRRQLAEAEDEHAPMGPEE